MDWIILIAAGLGCAYWALVSAAVAGIVIVDLVF